MANPTTNYGFVLPTPTDLVTDLPADFDVALQGVDTRLKALQPGTTLGDLAFSSATANTNTRLGIGTAGQVLAVVAGVPSWSTTADQTPLTTKGDLFTFTTVDARLAVGANGETLVADSSAATGLRYTAGNPISNPVINSCFDIWQRGTSVASVAGVNYTADRYTFFRGSYVLGATISRQATNDTTNLPNVQYCARVARDSGNTSTQSLNFGSSMETANAVPFAGKNITFSFYARAGANFSSASNALSVPLYSGTGTDQNITGAYTGFATVGTVTATLTTTWQRFSVTATVATTATELAHQSSYTPVGTAGANDYFEITGVQIDIGSVALPVRRNAATIQGETSACQRYYFRTANTTALVPHTIGFSTSTTAGQAAFPLPVSMRVAPTSIDFSLLQLSDQSSYDLSITAVTIAQVSSTSVGMAITNSATATAFRPCVIKNANNAAGYLGFSAEL